MQSFESRFFQALNISPQESGRWDMVGRRSGQRRRQKDKGRKNKQTRWTGREGGAKERGEPRWQGNKARGGGHRRGRKDKVLADFNHVEADIKDSLAGFKATL